MNRYLLFLFLFCATLSMRAEPPSCFTAGGGYTLLQQSQGSGNLGSFQASYLYQSAGSFYTGVTFKLEGGPVHYAGRSKNLLDIDTQERLGYAWGAADRSWILALFTGLGYRYLNHTETWFDVSFSSSYNNLYVPLGLSVEGKIGPYLCLGLSGQWRPQVYSTLTISSRHGLSWITERKWTSFLLEVPFSIKAYNQLYVTLIPFLDFWQEGRTLADFKLGLPIPEQTFRFIGLTANLNWYF